MGEIVEEVKVFSTPTCPWCVRVKQYLDEKNIKYSDIDVSRDQQNALAMVKRSGQMGVPQLWIGEKVVVGFDQEKIDEFLGL